jgi:competence protein ComEC
MGKGLAWILSVAEWVSDLAGARRLVTSPDVQVLPLISLGLLILILWQGRSRLIGLLPILFGFVLWAHSERPDILIADTGTLVGVMTDEGRALSKSRGAGFIALSWLENDGDMVEQAQAAARWEAHKGAGLSIRMVQGKKAIAELKSCRDDEFLILNAEPLHDLPCRVSHPDLLKETGALAFYVKAGKVEEITARQITGARIWNSFRTD